MAATAAWTRWRERRTEICKRKKADVSGDGTGENFGCTKEAMGEG
jgi:hypothetical protein